MTLTLLNPSQQEQNQLTLSKQKNLYIHSQEEAQENINPLTNDFLSSMKRNKKAQRIKEFEIKREKSLFPNVLLPSGSFVRENSSSKDICNQIRQLFQLPVPAVYCSSFIHDNETNHFFGIHLEYCVRAAVDAHVPDFSNITGRLGQSNPYKEKIGFDIENELSSLKNVKEVQVKEPEKEQCKPEEVWNMENMFDPDYKAGDYALKMEKEWAGPIQLQELTRSKKFLKAGIYSKDFVLLELNLLKVDRTNSTQPFKFPLPMDYGLQLLEKPTFFDLDVRMRLFYELTEGKSGKTPFIKIKSNIYLDRKPRKAENYPVCKCLKPENPADMGCGDDCLNRVMMFECLPGLCVLGEQCGNQRVQSQSIDKDLKVVETPGRGYGLMTKINIARDSFIMEYCGEVLSQETTLERMNTVYKDMKHYYFLDYSKGEVIDGCQKGTIARFINHSCEPNCRIEKWTVGGEYRIGVFAEKDISEGEELTYNYRFESFGLEQKCKCGAAACTGVMGTSKKEETKSLKKSLRKTILFSGFYSPIASEFWNRKNGREYLDTLFKNVVKLDYYYYSLRLFLVRNIRRQYKRYKSLQPSLNDDKTGRGTSTRRFSRSESMISVSSELMDRRR